MKKLLLLLCLFAFLITGCRTNDLAKYDLNGKGIIYKEYVKSTARKIEVEEANTADKKEDKTVLGIIASVGSDIVSGLDIARIKDAAKTEDIVVYVSGGLEDALNKYLDMQPVEDNPAFIAETTLEECKLILSDNNVSVMVRASARIIERQSGNIVWENSEQQTVPIEASGSSKDDSKSFVKFMNAMQLSSLTDEEINRVIGEAADDVGYKMGETLREDISDARKK